MFYKSIFIICIVALSLWAQTSSDSTLMGLRDSVSVVHGTDVFRNVYVYHTTWGVLESIISGVALGWIVWDTYCAGQMKMVHAYVGFAGAVLVVRSVWDIHIGKQNQRHYLQFQSFYPTGIKRMYPNGKEQYDLIIQ